VEKNKIGYYLPQVDTSQLLDKLKPLISDRELLMRQQYHARQLAEQQFSHEVLLPKWLGFIKEIRENSKKAEAYIPTH